MPFEIEPQDSGVTTDVVIHTFLFCEGVSLLLRLGILPLEVLISHQFLILASPLSSCIAERSLNWGTMVSLSEFEAKFEELEKSLRKTPKLANRKTSSLTVGFGDASEVTAETYHENGASDQNKIERGEFESNAFIIKHSKFAEEHFPERGSLDVCDNKSKESGKEYSLRQKVFEEIAVIFPSAFKHILGINERYPHVIIRPTYFDRVSSEEQFLALASVNAQFLSCCSIDAKKRGLQWLRRLSWGGNDVDSVPLYALLIARFEWAAWESFLQFERSSTMTQQVKQEASENKKIATKSISGRTETAAVDTKDLDYPRTHLLSILGDVLSHCGAMNDISMTIDSSSVAHYVAPFVDVCLATNCSSSSANCFQVENVILTPLSWLFSVNGLSSDVDLVVLDKAVAATLRRMDNHWSGMKQIKSEIDKSEQVQRLPSKKPLVSSSFESTGLNGSNERFFQKKNKGKKRKVSFRLC